MTANDTRQTDALMAQAGAALSRGEPGLAIGVLRELLAGNPGHAQACHLLGVLSLQQGDLPVAVSNLRIAARKISDPSVGINLAIALAQSGEPDQAQAVLLPIAEAHPDNVQAAFNLGHLLAQTGQQAAAEPWLRRAVAVDPGYLSAWSDLGSLLFDDDRLDDAAVCFGRVLELDPDRLPACFNMALIDHRQGRYAEAVRRFEACRAGMGTTRGVVLGLGASLQELGRVEEALALYRELLGRDREAYLMVLRNLTGCAKGISSARPSALRALLGMDQPRDL